MASTMGALLEEKLERSKRLFNRSASVAAADHHHHHPPMNKSDQKSLWSLFSLKRMTKREESSSMKEKRMEQSNNILRQGKAHFPMKPEEEKQKRKQMPTLHKGLASIASSLSTLSDTLGSAIEEGFMIMETRASQLISADHRKYSSLQQKIEMLNPYHQKKRGMESYSLNLEFDDAMQLKASEDIMAMATKAKLLLYELKVVKEDLDFTKDQCAQLQEENRSLREKLAKGIGVEEDELVRQQLEALLLEKSRLAQENAAYSRENRFLHEVVDCHQRTIQDLALLQDNLQEEQEDEVIFEVDENLQTNNKCLQRIVSI